MVAPAARDAFEALRGVPKAIEENVPDPLQGSDDQQRQQLLGQALLAFAPVALGAAVGGARGGQIGAEAGQKGLETLAVQQKEEKKRKEKKKEIEEEREFKIALEEAKLKAKESVGLAKASKGQESVDRAFGKEFNEFFARGGFADVQKNITQLKEVRQALRQTDTASGPVVGVLPKGIRDIVTPEGAALQDRVEEVVQRNLRLVLGAQFTEREGQRLIERAFNPRLPESENLKRLDALIGQIESAAQAKVLAAEHFQQHGTLAGFDATGVVDRLSVANTQLEEQAPPGSRLEDAFQGILGAQKAEAAAEVRAIPRAQLEALSVEELRKIRDQIRGQ